MKESKTIKSLSKIISGQVLYEKEILEYYSVDASSYQIFPKAVVIAKDEKDVIALVKYSNKTKTPVTVRGAGTGLVGGALNDGIILDLKNLNSINIEENFVRVGSGISKGLLDKKLKEKNKFFPPNPSIGSFCSIGGMIGNNASGSHSVKYGSVIDNVEEITMINGRGEKITLPADINVGKKIISFSKKINAKKFPSTSKNSSGYRIDAVKSLQETQKVIVGSEGTLGIVISSKLAIRDIPKSKILFVIEYSALQTASKDCRKILQTSPSAIEFIDRNTMKYIPEKFNKKIKCMLFVEYDSDFESKEESLKKIIDGNITVRVSNEREIANWWKYRDSSLHYSLKSINKKKIIPHIIEDAAVPIEKIESLFSLIKKINQKFDTKSIMYGHAGNANIHVRLILDRKKILQMKLISKYYFREVINMGGTISGEHGDGLARTEYIKLQYGNQNHQIFKKIKKFFDPNSILNPNKIISDKSTMLKNIQKNT